MYILSKIKGSRILTNVLKRLKALQPLQQILIGGQNLENKKRSFTIYSKGDELRITLWGNYVRSFDVVALQELSSFVIVVFAKFHVSKLLGQPFHLQVINSHHQFSI
ncbi:hypothetical protein NC652_018937 [Populus alba x Populus x berolinensis]|nr:hypothetical protein NC652_018937 [Populus alba x Populus x berolinensis]